MTELTSEKIAALRVDYAKEKFDESDVLSDPFKQFEFWFKEALSAEVNEPNAMTLATVKPDGTPSARIVLLKGFSEKGFTFFTNYNSHKGQQLSANGHVALVFCWLELHRQVRIEGKVERLSGVENDEYFYSRPIGSQLGAIASPQSSVVENRMVLEQNMERAQKEADLNGIKRPEHWGGYVVVPQTIEFWQGRPSRLHDRFLFEKQEDGWKRSRLAP